MTRKQKAITERAFGQRLRENMEGKKREKQDPYECFRERLACFGELEVLDGEWEKTKACLAEFFCPENFRQSAVCSGGLFDAAGYVPL